MPTRDVASGLVHRVARAISARRRALGLTQEALADRLELAVKNVQRIEAGAQNLTLASLERIATALAIAPARLLDEHPSEVDPAPPVVRMLKAAGYSVRPASARGRRAAGAIPVTSIVAAAGALTGSARAIEAVAWVNLSRKGAPPEGQFVATVEGRSMEPRIQDGAVCLFGPPGPPPYRSRILLVGHPALADSELDGPFALKQIEARKLRDGRRRIVLHSLNSAFPPIAADDDVQVLAELVDVLAAPSHSRRSDRAR